MPIVIEGMNELKKTIHEIEQAVDPKIERMADISRLLLASIDNTIVTNGRGSWQQQAPSTRAGVGGTLEFSGKLRTSMQVKLGKQFAEVRPSNEVYKYAAVNHYGSKSGRIPARPFMRLWPEDIDNIMKIYEQPIDQAMRK